jgi:hypothetical protein
MRGNHIGLLICGFAVAALAFGRAWPQPMPQADDFPMHTIRQPYNIETFGEFRKLIMTGDFTAKVQLVTAMAKHRTVGVGGLADARGEISIFEDKLVVSYGEGGKPADDSSEYAQLLVLGSVSDWQSVRADEDVAAEDIETYIAAAAKARGIDTNKSFPFEVKGNIGPYAMHVNVAPIDGPHGMGLPVAVKVEHGGDSLDALVAGVYVSPDLEGIATRSGERTHAHWVSSDATSTAHLDRWGIRAGAFLLLPKPGDTMGIPLEIAPLLTAVLTLSAMLALFAYVFRLAKERPTDGRP